MKLEVVNPRVDDGVILPQDVEEDSIVVWRTARNEIYILKEDSNGRWGFISLFSCLDLWFSGIDNKEEAINHVIDDGEVLCFTGPWRIKEFGEWLSEVC